MVRTVAAVIAGLALALSDTASASAQGTAQVSPPSTCAEYAGVAAPGDWACVNGTITRYSPTGAISSVTELPEAAAAVSPLAVVDSYTSNVTEEVLASLNGVGYRIPVSVKTRLYNHSPRLTMGYSSSKAVSLIWSVRVRRDNNLAPDDTVFTFPDAYGSYTRVGLFTATEGERGDGYNSLPYDGKRYFIDLYNLRLYDGKSTLNIQGSVQSDRMTCYKTVSCKFN